MAPLSKNRALLAACLAIMIVGRLAAQEQLCNNARQCMNPERRKAAEQALEMNKEWYRSRGVRPISRYGKRQMRYSKIHGVGAVPLAMLPTQFYKSIAIRFPAQIQKPQQFGI